MSDLLQLIANGLVTGSIISIAAIGLSLVYGILKIVNFAHGDYLTFCAFMAFLVNVTWGGHMVTAVLFAMAATALLGIVLELILWRPMRRRGAGIAPALGVFNPHGAIMRSRAEVAELGDALDSKSSGALPRAGSIPAFGIRLTCAPSRSLT